MKREMDGEAEEWRMSMMNEWLACRRSDAGLYVRRFFSEFNPFLSVLGLLVCETLTVPMRVREEY